MSLSNEHLQEIQKLQKSVTQLEKILKLSTNPMQKKRVASDIQTYKEKLKNLSPEADSTGRAKPSIKKEQAPIDKEPKAAPLNKPVEHESILSQFNVVKISPNSNEHEINMIGTLLNILDMEFIPAIMDTHVKFDYSHAAERDGVIKHMENIRRNVKVLTETIEEYAQTEKQEFREQLGRMKNKQARIFITEAYDVFKKFKEFVDGILTELESGNNVILNLDDPINFNPRFEKATLLENNSIEEALRTFDRFLDEALDNIDIPNLK